MRRTIRFSVRLMPSESRPFGTGMARDTYLSKIVVKHEDIAPTLSLGITINHVVSMSIPALGGILWMKYGHSSVFMGASCISVLMLIFASRVRIPSRPT